MELKLNQFNVFLSTYVNLSLAGGGEVKCPIPITLFDNKSSINFENLKCQTLYLKVQS